jgi:hypothetical protein
VGSTSDCQGVGAHSWSFRPCSRDLNDSNVSQFNGRSLKRVRLAKYPGGSVALPNSGHVFERRVG